MNIGRPVFSQVMDFLPLHEFRKCVRQYNGDAVIERIFVRSVQASTPRPHSHFSGYFLAAFPGIHVHSWKTVLVS
ncbi:MAG: DUF4372 domain-containing protein [Phycisphaerae bacterium]